MEIEKQSNLNSNKKAEFRLTDEQLKFILAPKNRDIKVTACAGSGKTECALQFIKSAIDEGQDPRSISITTFNIQASVDMKKRAIQLMGKENANKIEIINFDKIIFKLYKQIKKIKSAINNELINNNKNNKQVIDITLVEKQYEVYLNLQDLSFTKYFQSKKLVVFDEFQDINQLHYDILMLFKKVGNSVLVVLGDEAQNIYEFRGSNFKYLNQIVEDVNRENKKIYGNEDYNMLEFKLTTNFRCSSKITDFANDIIRYFNFKDFNQNTMISFEDLNYGKEIKKCDVKPSLIAYPNYNNLVQDIIIQINVLIKNYGFSYKDFAIISPTTFTLYQVELFLQKYNYFEPETEIPFWSFIGKSKEFGYKYEYQADKIMILTGHKSKGLQWKVVFEVGMEDNLFPLSFLRKTEHDLDEFNKVEELKRLFYVMSTRTSQFLYISYISHNNNDQLNVLSKVAILKLKYGRDIKKIEFYNPIKGTILQIYLQNWTFHKDIINFIFQFQSKLKDSDQNISQDIQTQNCTQQTLQTVLVDQGDISQTLGNSLKIQEKTLKSQKDNLNIKEENSSEILRISQQYQNQLINQLKQQSSQSSFEDKMNFDAHMTKQNQNLHIENAKTSNKQQILINSKKNQKSYDSQQIDEKNNKFLNKLI